VLVREVPDVCNTVIWQPRHLLEPVVRDRAAVKEHKKRESDEDVVEGSTDSIVEET